MHTLTPAQRQPQDRAGGGQSEQSQARRRTAKPISKLHRRLTSGFSATATFQICGGVGAGSEWLVWVGFPRPAHALLGHGSLGSLAGPACPTPARPALLAYRFQVVGRHPHPPAAGQCVGGRQQGRSGWRPCKRAAAGPRATSTTPCLAPRPPAEQGGPHIWLPRHSSCAPPSVPRCTQIIRIRLERYHAPNT